MDENNKMMPENEIDTDVANPVEDQEKDERLREDLSQIREDVSYLRDLFVRRLNDDKQKAAAVQKLIEGATFAFVEPFLYDIILLLDRLERSEDDFVASVYEELYGILNRRGVEKIHVTSEFDPALNKAVKVVESSEADVLRVSGIIRNGYTLSGKVIRPAEVVVEKPVQVSGEKEEA